MAVLAGVIPLKWGTGMIPSSSTFRPNPGRVIRDLFRLLNAVYGIVRNTSLQQSSKGMSGGRSPRHAP